MVGVSKLGELRGSPDRIILSQDTVAHYYKFPYSTILEEGTMYTCTRCNQEKPTSDFTGWPRRKWCKACNAAYQKDLRSRGYKPTGRNKRLASLSMEDRELWAVLATRYASLCTRSGTVEVDTQWLFEQFKTQSGVCPLTGWSMSTEVGDTLRVVSVDQKTPGAGYTADNTQLVCWAANRAKGELSQQDFVEMCRAVVRCNDYPERE